LGKAYTYLRLPLALSRFRAGAVRAAVYGASTKLCP